mmetsp:Transcript_10166/g.23555  ORF Transcript_10166/g.23555 Transcript_10166/m.23555 type:complete len:209 (+) Transcript_10166:622-1248(+)
MQCRCPIQCEDIHHKANSHIYIYTTQNTCDLHSEDSTAISVGRMPVSSPPLSNNFSAPTINPISVGTVPDIPALSRSSISRLVSLQSSLGSWVLCSCLRFCVSSPPNLRCLRFDIKPISLGISVSRGQSPRSKTTRLEDWLILEGMEPIKLLLEMFSVSRSGNMNNSSDNAPERPLSKRMISCTDDDPLALVLHEIPYHEQNESLDNH